MTHLREQADHREKRQPHLLISMLSLLVLLHQSFSVPLVLLNGSPVVFRSSGAERDLEQVAASSGELLVHADELCRLVLDDTLESFHAGRAKCRTVVNVERRLSRLERVERSLDGFGVCVFGLSHQGKLSALAVL